MKDFFFLLVGLVFVLGSVFIFFTQQTDEVETIQTIRIGEATVIAEIRDDPSEHAEGLSGRESLEEGSGMLFIFDDAGVYGFWMEDMNFAIDIIWINQDFRVVGIEESVSPETYPRIFYPNEPVKYVLELPSGFAGNNGIDTGSEMSFE